MLMRWIIPDFNSVQTHEVKKKTLYHEDILSIGYSAQL